MMAVSREFSFLEQRMELMEIKSPRLNARSICPGLLFFCLFILIFLLVFQLSPVFACRYNVRETGFIDLGIDPYYLFGYVDRDTPAEAVSSFQEILAAALMDSNIKFEMIEVKERNKHPAMQYFQRWQLQTFPSAVLVSPDGQSLPVQVKESDRPFKDTLWSALEGILFSPKRKEILHKAAKTYGVVLLIEGADGPDNERARKEVTAAIRTIASQMDTLPKAIALPPEMVVLDGNSISAEGVLLWTLGLEREKIDKPLAAVFYGRGRWIGPLFEGEQITEDNLLSVLFIIGADCECGFDYRWLQGTMLPAKWDEKLHAQAVKSLGFDPENPMIKMEISSIIGRGLGGYYYAGAPAGYQEAAAEPASEDHSGQIPTTQVQKNASATSRTGISPNLPSGESLLAESESALQKPLFFIVGLAALVIAIGLVIVLGAARKGI